MTNYDVSVAPCDSYDDARVEAALRDVLEPIHGLDFITPGMTVGIKVNLIAPMKPETAATVHPAVVCALTRMIRERGAGVVIGDSPGGLYTAPYLKMVYDVSGMRAAEAFGARLNDDFSQADVHFPEAAQARQFPCTAWLEKVDAIIDVCKLKTHGMMGLTCAVKNFFGAIPGTKKPEFHYRFPRSEDFADMLVDLYEYFKPRLCICDAVIGMEGNGPTQGAPRKIGCLLAGRNGHCLDAVAAGLIGLKIQDVPTLQAAARRALLPEDASRIPVRGDLSPFVQPDFQTVQAQSNVSFRILGDSLPGRIAERIAARILTPFPKLEPSECVGCKKCAQVCPAKAITMHNNRPRINRSTCIHCFCCQEFCPKGAMRVGRRAIMRLLGR